MSTYRPASTPRARRVRALRMWAYLVWLTVTARAARLAAMIGAAVSPLPPLVGGAPDDGDGDGDGDDDGEDDDDDGDDDERDKGKDKGKDKGGDKGKGGSDDGDDDDAESLRERLARIEARDARRDEERKAAEKKARDEAAGDDPAALRKLLEEERAEREQDRKEALRDRAESRVLAAAENARSHDSDDVVRLLDLDKITDAASARRAVAALKAEKPHLFAKTRRQASNAGDDGDGSRRSRRDRDDGDREERTPVSPKGRLRQGYDEAAK